jgi:NAD+ synthase (glutamine-hydrolysing)
MAPLRLAACQVNQVVGDIQANLARMREALFLASDKEADLAVFPELAVTGYPPEDLLTSQAFLQDNLAGLEEFAKLTASTCPAVVGFVAFAGPEAKPPDARKGPLLYNAAALCEAGGIKAVVAKRALPNYGVFDEARYFVTPSDLPHPLEVAGHRLGIAICEDLWVDGGAVDLLGQFDLEAIVVVNASPFAQGRLAQRIELATAHARRARTPVAYVNLVGGQDELVFDGGSFLVDQRGALVRHAGLFEAGVWILEPEEDGGSGDEESHEMGSKLPREPLESPWGTARRAQEIQDRLVYEALVLATRDYVHKNGFSDVLVGLSGGIDSSLVAVIACDALGREHVHGVSMPSRYSSEGSVLDAKELAARLGIGLELVEIEPAHRALEALCSSAAGSTQLQGLAAENLQARIRGCILMTLSNSTGWLVLTTGNKSEVATGYSTLYGDMAGGFAVIRDVPKTQVYRLARLRNAIGGSPIPESVLTKAPSAELAPNQRDEESLAPYALLDPVIEGYVEKGESREQLLAEGYPQDLVDKVVMLVDRAEYKRRQGPPGPKITERAFGRDRRMPITNGYRPWARP